MYICMYMYIYISFLRYIRKYVCISFLFLIESWNASYCTYITFLFSVLETPRGLAVYESFFLLSLKRREIIIIFTFLYRYLIMYRITSIMLVLKIGVEFYSLWIFFIEFSLTVVSYVISYRVIIYYSIYLKGSTCKKLELI